MKGKNSADSDVEEEVFKSTILKVSTLYVWIMTMMRRRIVNYAGYSVAVGVFLSIASVLIWKRIATAINVGT